MSLHFLGYIYLCGHSVIQLALQFSNLSNSFSLVPLETLFDLSNSFVYSIYFIFVSVVHVKDNYPKVEMELSNDCIQR